MASHTISGNRISKGTSWVFSNSLSLIVNSTTNHTFSVSAYCYLLILIICRWNWLILSFQQKSHICPYCIHFPQSFLRALGPIVLFTVLMLSLVVVIVYTQDGEIHRWYGRTGRLSHGIETFHKWDSPSGGGISEKSGSFCVTHPKCKSLNLTGSCCPTLEGDLLGCCVRNNSNTHPHQSNATCTKHPRCWSLNLTTDCCPTANGNILECCDLPNDAIWGNFDEAVTKLTNALMVR